MIVLQFFHESFNCLLQFSIFSIWTHEWPSRERLMKSLMDTAGRRFSAATAAAAAADGGRTPTTPGRGVKECALALTQEVSICVRIIVQTSKETRTYFIFSSLTYLVARGIQL